MDVFIFGTDYFVLLQRGHIYTSSGSFFIEPVEEYTLNNPNILHKISREKLPLNKRNFAIQPDGKSFVDEAEDEIVKNQYSNENDLTDEVEEIESTETINNNSTAPCTTSNGGSKYKQITFCLFITSFPR